MIKSAGRFVAILVLMLELLVCAGVTSAQVATSGTTAQQRAVKLFPDLAKPGSDLNWEFVRRYKLYQSENPAYFNNPEWPTQLARESAGASATTEASAGEGPAGNLSTADIFKRAQEKYASLKSYSDEGKIVGSMNGATVTTTFTTKLARPRLYRIEWQQTTETASSSVKTPPQALWSAGEGDFLKNARGEQKLASSELAFASTTGISGGATAAVPGTFFATVWGNQFVGSGAGKRQEAAEKVGDVDCYVLTWELQQGSARTLWIGKQDFLIHQMRDLMSPEAFKAATELGAKNNPAHKPVPAQLTSQGISTTETHTNIVTNPSLTPSDFAASKP